MRETLFGKNYSLFTLNRRQVTDIHKVSHITEHDCKTLSNKELAKKYGVSKKAVSLHFINMNTVRLDSAAIDTDGDDTDNYNNFIDDKDTFEAVEVPITYDQMFAYLEKHSIEEYIAKSVLSSLLTYSESSLSKRGFIKKASKRVYYEIAHEVGVPFNVVQTVIHVFCETFV